VQKWHHPDAVVASHWVFLKDLIERFDDNVVSLTTSTVLK
jgi:hypothetical protein